MKQSKLLTWLGRLSDPELEDLVAFAGMPSLQKVSSVVRVFEEYRALSGENGKKDILQDALIKRVWPDKEIKAGYWNKVSSAGIAVLKEFIAWQHWRKKPGELSVELVEYFSGEDLDSEFQTSLREAEALVEAGRPLSEDMMHLHLRLQMLKADHHFKAVRSPRVSALDGVVQAWQEYFRAGMLRYGTARKNLMLAFGAEVGDDDLTLANDPDALPVLSRAYAHAYNLLAPDTAATAFDALRALLQEEGLSKAHTWDLYSYLLNHTIRRVRAGEERFQVVAKELYGEILEQMREEGEPIMAWTFRNMLVTLVRLGEVGWAETFLQQHRDYLANDHAENAVNYGEAILCHAKGEYHRARTLLNRVLNDYRNQFYGIYARYLLWKCNVELEEVDYLEDSQQAYLKFFGRSTLLNESEKRMYQYLFRWSLQMLVLDLALPEKRRAGHETLIEKARAEPWPEFRWLQSKLEERLA